MSEDNRVVPLQSAEGSLLCTVSYYRMADGSIRASLDDMPGHVIEAESTITQRFWNAAQWTLPGMLDLMRQGLRFDDEHRATLAENDDPSPSPEPRP